MHRTMLVGSASALALIVSACGSGEEATPNETVAENDINMVVADPNNPFAQAEMQMNERMTAAVGADPSETWIRKMIEHHRGAVAMADIVLAQNPTPKVRAEAEETRTEQLKEIGELETMLTDDAPAAAAPATTAPAARASSAPAVESRPASNERPTTKPAPKPALKPAEPADPHAGHVMNNTQ